MMPTRGLKNAIALAWSTLLWKRQAKLGTSLSSVFFRQPLELTFFPRLCTLRIVLCVCSSGGFYLPSNYGFWIDTVKRLWCGCITIIIGLLLLLLCPPTAWFSEASLSRNSSVFFVNWFFFSCSVFLFQLSPSGWTVWSSNFNYANRDNLSMFVFSILFRLTQVIVWRKSQYLWKISTLKFFLAIFPRFLANFLTIYALVLNWMQGHSRAGTIQKSYSKLHSWFISGRHSVWCC
jgi:hypothetical protein